MVQPMELATDRLRLRPFAFSDVPDVVAYADDGDWATYLPIPRPYAQSDGEEFVAKAVLKGWESGPQLAIVLDGTVIGSMGLRVDVNQRCAELGYGIGRRYWGKGLTAEAAAALLDWAFPAYDLGKAYARADARNVQSWRVMEKLSMIREAFLRKHRIHAGERVDEVWYGVLREDWEARGRQA